MASPSKKQKKLSAASAIGLVAGAWAAYRVWAWAQKQSAPRFAGATVVVTGGSRGLGLVLAREFAKEGARLALIARNADELDRAVADLRERRAEAERFVCDVANEAEVSEAVDKIAARFGGVDVLVNDAGVIRVATFAAATADDYSTAMNTHFWGPLRMIQKTLPWLRKSSRPRIVNIASFGGKIGVPHLIAYSASKHALVGFSDALRAELAVDKIPVTVVCPGTLRTGSIEQAEFRGDLQAEYAWFATGASLPGISLSAESAARAIIDACRIGQAELVLPWHANAAAKARAIFPQAFARALAFANRAILPEPNGEKNLAKGRDISRGRLVESASILSTRAAKRNNETILH